MANDWMTPKEKLLKTQHLLDNTEVPDKVKPAIATIQKEIWKGIGLAEAGNLKGALKVLDDVAPFIDVIIRKSGGDLTDDELEVLTTQTEREPHTLKGVPEAPHTLRTVLELPSATLRSPQSEPPPSSDDEK